LHRSLLIRWPETTTPSPWFDQRHKTARTSMPSRTRRTTFPSTRSGGSHIRKRVREVAEKCRTTHQGDRGRSPKLTFSGCLSTREQLRFQTKLNRILQECATGIARGRGPEPPSFYRCCLDG